MAEENPIFRKVALDRLSSPEQLDRLLQITSPKGWLALTAIGGVVMIAVLWGIFGGVHTTVHGDGILIQGGNVYDVVTPGGGVVTQILVQAGQEVARDELVARIRQPQLELKITNTTLFLSQLEKQNAELLIYEGEDLRITTNSLNQEYANVQISIEKYTNLISKLREKQASQQKALDSELIVKSALLATEIEVFSAEQEQRRADQRLLQIKAGLIGRPMQIQQDRTARQQRIHETRYELELLNQQYTLTSEVRSSYEGTVLEVVVDPGSFVIAGARVLSLETHQQLQAVIFTPPDQGKRVKTNFEVRLSPGTVKKEVAGFMIGRVERVSPYPSTPERLMRVLRNQGLVNQLSGYGAPIEVLVLLQTNLDGSYKWSSKHKKTNDITSGTLCGAAIVVDTNSPISLLLPAFQKSVGM